MTLYKVRRKLTISVSEEETVHAVFRDPGGEMEHSSCGHRLVTRAPHLGSTFCDGGEVGEELEPLDIGSQTYPDPRLGALGHRLVVARGLEGGALVLLPPGSQECHPNTYNHLRYCSLLIHLGELNVRQRVLNLLQLFTFPAYEGSPQAELMKAPS